MTTQRNDMIAPPEPFKLADAAAPLDLARLVAAAADGAAADARLAALRQLLPLLNSLDARELAELVDRAVEMKLERLHLGPADADRRELALFDQLETVALAEAAAAIARAIAAGPSAREHDARVASCRRTAAFWLGQMGPVGRTLWLSAVAALRETATRFRGVR